MSKLIGLDSVTIKLGGNGYTDAIGQTMVEDNKIRQQLSRIRPSSKQGNNLVIKCPFHNDSRPSLAVNFQSGLVRKNRKIPVGYYACWSCGARGGYNQLADKLSLPRIERDPNETSTHQSLEPIKVSNREYELAKPRVSKYWQTKLKCTNTSRLVEDWRGFDYRFLSSLGCCVTKRWGNKWLWIPVKENTDKDSKLWGAIAARWSSVKNKPSYINAKGQWVSSNGLWPLHAIVSSEPRIVFLVEGPRDALRLIKLGIPALAVLGTQTVTSQKLDNLLTSLTLDCVVLAFDGDKAGALCRDKAIKLLRGKIKTLDLGLVKYAKTRGLKKIDPNEVPFEFIRDFWKKYGDPESRKRLIKHLNLK